MKKKSLKLIVSTIVITMALGVFISCESKKEKSGVNTISISGSTSVGPLMEKIAEEYESINNNLSIEINQVGSSAGIKDTINGVSQIGMASRELKKEEEDKVTGTIIAYDGMALIIHKDNPVKEITLEQIKDIYTGKITNWSELNGGLDAPIVVISREDGSGTRSAFEEIVGYKSEELIPSASITDGNGSIKTTVSGNKNAIGFVSFEYLDNTVRALEIDGVKAEAEFVKNGEYKLSRPFILVTNASTLKEESEMLIEYILSDEGQQIVKENKFISVN